MGNVVIPAVDAVVGLGTAFFDDMFCRGRDHIHRRLIVVPDVILVERSGGLFPAAFHRRFGPLIAVVKDSLSESAVGRMNEEKHRVRFHIRRRILVVQIDDHAQPLVGIFTGDLLGDPVAECDDAVGRYGASVRADTSVVQLAAFATGTEFSSVVCRDRKHLGLRIVTKILDSRLREVIDDFGVAGADLTASFFGIVLGITFAVDFGEPFRMIFAIDVGRQDTMPGVSMPNVDGMPQPQTPAERFVRLAVRRFRELAVTVVWPVDKIDCIDGQFVVLRSDRS